jgi:hypothetical protein
MAGGNVTSADLIQAMVEIFRMYGMADSNMGDSEGKVIMTEQHLSLIVTFVERADTRQWTVPSVTRSNANTVVDLDTKKKHAGN